MFSTNASRRFLRVYGKVLGLDGSGSGSANCTIVY